MSENKKVPNIFIRAINFIKALFNHAKTGMKYVTMDIYEERIATCRVCPDRKDGACTLCGCNLAVKAKWREQECPAGKWKM